MLHKAEARLLLALHADKQTQSTPDRQTDRERQTKKPLRMALSTAHTYPLQTGGGSFVTGQTHHSPYLFLIPLPNLVDLGQKVRV